MIVVTSLLRMLLFVVELIARIISGSSDSKCEEFKPLAGSLVMLAYTLVMEVIPIAVLLLLFKFKFNARRLGTIRQLLRRPQHEYDATHAKRNRLIRWLWFSIYMSTLIQC